ncbi:hypothetical protein FB446DRAFT_309205 [Lentinula raphanica]|nr:hypothetical protein FB446DRAFT_309205 [Lentinula raphanica]
MGGIYITETSQLRQNFAILLSSLFLPLICQLPINVFSNPITNETNSGFLQNPNLPKTTAVKSVGSKEVRSPRKQISTMTTITT